MAKKEKIKIEPTLSVFSYPTQDFSPSKSKYVSFILGKKQFYHNGIHIDSNKAVQAVGNGIIVAYKYIDDYKVKDFDIDTAEFTNEQIPLVCSNLSKLDEFFEKNEKGNFVFTENVKNNDEKKRAALNILNKLYSDSYFIIKHEVKNRANQDIVFYSLYNHLKPFKNMTVGQKVNLPYYFSEYKIKLLTVEKYSFITGTDEKGNPVQIPSEVKYTENKDYEYIQWTLNKKTFRGIIKSDKIKPWDGFEIKRPGDRENVDLTNLTDYEDKSNNIVILYSSDNLSARKVVATVSKKQNFIVTISDFESFLNDKKKAIKVFYGNEYLYVFTSSKNEMKQSYEKFKTDNNGSKLINIEFSFNDGIKINLYSNSYNYKYLENSYKTKLIPRNSSPFVKLNSIFEYDENNKKEKITSEICYIPCETKVTKIKGTEELYINWTYVNKDDAPEGGYVTKVKRTDLREDYLETKRVLKCWENRDSTDFLPRGIATKGDKILIYDNELRADRHVIDCVNTDTEFKIVDINKLIEIFNNKNNKEINDCGICVSYGNKKTGYIYINWEGGLNHDPYEINHKSGGVCPISSDIQRNTRELFNDKDSENNDISIIGKARTEVMDFLSSIESKNTDFKKNFDYFELTLKKNPQFKMEYIKTGDDKLEIKNGQIIGYTGYSITSEKEEKREENEDATSLHFEIFCNKTDFLKNDIKEDNKINYPCYLKVNGNCTIKQGKLTTVTNKKILFNKDVILDKKNIFGLFKKQNKIGIIDPEVPLPVISITNTCLEILEEGFLVDGEVFYKLRKIANIVDFDENEYFNKQYIKWDKNTTQYASKSEKDVDLELFDHDNKKIEGKTIPFYSDIPYLDASKKSSFEEDLEKNKRETVKYIEPGAINFTNTETEEDKKDLYKLRRFKFYYIKCNSYDDFYVKKETVQKFETKKLIDTERTFLFIYGDSELKQDDILEQPTQTKWTVEETQLNQIKKNTLSYDYKKIKEFSTLTNHKKPLHEWMEVDSEYYIDSEYVKDDVDGIPVGRVYYDNWKDFFKEIKLENYRLNIQREADIRTFLGKIELQNLYGQVGNMSLRQIIRENSSTVMKYYFTRESEWSDSEELTKEYINLDKNREEEIKGYRKDLGFFTDDFAKKIDVSKNNTYFQPVAFLNHLDKVVIPEEFNPYEGRTFKYEWNYMDQQKQSCPRIQDVISNIGFVPGTFKDNVLIPVEPNGLFRERYPSKNTTKPYPHEGVDFGAAYGTDIYATICGEVIAIKDQKDKHYGYHLLIKSDDGYIFLLGHLSSILVSKDQRITPNTLVAKVGNSGNCYTGGHKLTPTERANHLGAHLHLSVFKGKKITDIYDKDSDAYTYSERLRNPFNREHNWKTDL